MREVEWEYVLEASVFVAFMKEGHSLSMCISVGDKAVRGWSGERLDLGWFIPGELGRQGIIRFKFRAS